MDTNATEIWLVRHGQSAANAGLPTESPEAIELTASGQAQAQALAQWLPEAEYTIWSSHYRRAQDTARPALARWNTQVREHPQLHEFVTLDPVRCARTTYAERMPWVTAYWLRSDPDFRDGEGAESFREFLQRVETVRRDLQDPAGKTLVFGHGMFFCLWIWRELGFPADTSAAMAAFRRFNVGLPMPNAGIYRLVRQGSAWQVRVHAERLHCLAANTRADVVIQ